jgi:crotonobetaine/carnitine-CoA ligase
MTAETPPLPALVEIRARATPERVALTSAERGSVTWRELESASFRWANWLGRHGIGEGDYVVTLIPQSVEAAYVWLACATVGAVEVSINTAFRGEWMRHALAVSKARVVVLSERFLGQVLPCLEGTSVETLLIHDALLGPRALTSVEIATDSPDREEDTPPSRPVSVGQHDTACVLYTSGTTGASKAVLIPWRQLALSLAVDPAFEHPDRQTFYLPYAPYHLSGRCALYRGALAGGHTVVRESFSTSAFWTDVKRFGCTWTILYAAPTRFLMALPETAADRENPLEWALMCPLLPEVDRFKQRFGVEVYSVYGMTEIGNPIRVASEDATSDRAGCCGRPIDGVEARLVDAFDYPVPAGRPGELVLRSRDPWSFTSGYLGAPEASAKAWRNGWFHTGDIMRRADDGNFYYLDRAKDMIRRRGENVASAELEAAILKCPLVAEVAVVGVPSAVGDEDILAAIVPKQHPLAFAEVIRFLQDIVPRFALPRYIRVMEALPRTQATQRVEKHVLRDAGLTGDCWDRDRA